MILTFLFFFRIMGPLITINMMSPGRLFFRPYCARWHARSRVAAGSISDKTRIDNEMINANTAFRGIRNVYRPHVLPGSLSGDN